MRTERSLFNAVSPTRSSKPRRAAFVATLAAVLVAVVAPPAQATVSAACLDALVATQSAISVISPIVFGGGPESIDAPGLTLEQRRARAQAFCTSEGFVDAQESLKQINAVCGDGDVAGVLDLSDSLYEIQRVLNLSCLQFEGQYCLPNLYELSENGISSTPTVAELDEICQPCVRKVYAAMAALPGGDAHASVRSALEIMCLKHADEYCLPQWNAFAANPPAAIDAYVEQYCSTPCIPRIATRIYPPGTPNPFTDLGICDRDPADGQYCLPQAVAAITAFSDAIATGSIPVDNTIDCVPGAGSTCALSGGPCSGHDDCRDTCGATPTCLGGTLDGSACTTAANCSETCNSSTGTCTRTGGPCTGDSDCPERSIPCEGSCGATGGVCSDDSQCADGANVCSASVCGHATTTRCSSDAECPSGPCMASFCFDTSAGETCTNRSECTGAGSAESLDATLERILAGFGCCEHSVALALNKTSPAVVWPYEAFLNGRGEAYRCKAPVASASLVLRIVAPNLKSTRLIDLACMYSSDPVVRDACVTESVRAALGQ